MLETSLGAVVVANIELIQYLNYWVNYAAVHFPSFFGFVKGIISIYLGLSIPVSLALFIAIVIYVEKLKAIRKKEYAIYNAKVDMGYIEKAPEKPKGNVEFSKKWDLAIKNIESENPSDWRQAVLEADIILGSLLTQLGYKGEGIGEQLKRATKGDFKTLDEAWEAHKIRNELAHSGSEYPFSQHEAKRVINLYRKVFEEFFHI